MPGERAEGHAAGEGPRRSCKSLREQRFAFASWIRPGRCGWIVEKDSWAGCESTGRARCLAQNFAQGKKVGWTGRAARSTTSSSGRLSVTTPNSLKRRAETITLPSNDPTALL
jgi:hypothetical protein